MRVKSRQNLDWPDDWILKSGLGVIWKRRVSNIALGRFCFYPQWVLSNDLDYVPRLSSWWEHMVDKQWLASHPIKFKKDFKQWAIPLRLFGDGVACLGLAKSWGRSIDTITLSSVLNQGHSKWSHIILTLIWKVRRHPSTLVRAWKILQWSLQCLLDGNHPTKNFSGEDWPPGSWQAQKAGQPLAGGHVGVLVVCLLDAS